MEPAGAPEGDSLGDVQVDNKCNDDGLGNRWSPSCVDVDDDRNDLTRGIGGGAEWEQREYPNRTVRRPTALNRRQRFPLSCDASYLGRSSAWADGH